jgi:hypothetical protein
MGIDKKSEKFTLGKEIFQKKSYATKKFIGNFNLPLAYLIEVIYNNITTKVGKSGAKCSEVV